MLRPMFLVGTFVMLMAVRSGHAALNSGSDADIPKLRANLIAWCSRGAPSANTIERYMTNMDQAGTWPDIDYTNTDRGGWPARQHLRRMLAMAQAYAKVGHPMAGNPKLQAAVERSLTNWVREDYQNANWWFGRIGIPILVGPTLVLMGDDLNPGLRQKAITQLLGRSKMGMTGQNKVWVAGIALMKGVLTNDYDLIAKAREAIFEELHITTKEGIQPDMSFHQHGPQQQWGNYGASFGGDMLQWAAIFKGTDHELSPEQLDLLSRYLLDGSAWILWKGRMDISGCGRQIFKGCQRSKGRSILSQLRLLDQIAMPEGQRYERIMASNTRGAANTFIGNKHFWRSDITVHRRPNWYASVKMSSTRVIGAETCNSENMQGLHLGDGVTYFYRTGREYEDLVPVWDWRRLPGTTCRQDAGSLTPGSKRCRGRSDFVGGVSDGTRGVATMEYIRDGLRARKAWFFLDDAVVCLGVGITSETPESVLTSINQCALQGPVTVSQNQDIQTLDRGERLSGRLDWVHHDGMGYLLLGAEEATVGAVTQRGDWYHVHHRDTKQIVHRDIFNLWIDHGTRPNGAHYAYVVLPDIAADDMPTRCQSMGLDVLKQMESLLAVSSRNGKFVQAIFFEPGRLMWKGDLYLVVDAPCVVMLDSRGRAARLSLADPTHQRQSLTVRLSGRYEGHNAQYNAGERETIIAIDLPQEGLTGQSVIVQLQSGDNDGR